MYSPLEIVCYENYVNVIDDVKHKARYHVINCWQTCWWASTLARRREVRIFCSHSLICLYQVFTKATPQKILVSHHRPSLKYRLHRKKFFFRFQWLFAHTFHYFPSKFQKISTNWGVRPPFRPGQLLFFSKSRVANHSASIFRWKIGKLPDYNSVCF